MPFNTVSPILVLVCALAGTGSSKLFDDSWLNSQMQGAKSQINVPFKVVQLVVSLISTRLTKPGMSNKLINCFAEFQTFLP
jgi:hypothetical protein